MVALSAHGLTVDLLEGWEGRILLRAARHARERTRPVVHLANFALPERRGDFGAGVVEHMGGRDLLVVLFEHDPASAGTPLFAHRGRPRLRPELFSSRRLQRTLPGQLGCQLFFTEAGRAFCLYVVAGSRVHLARLVSEANRTLAGVVVA
jgi:hypothetical protein